MTLSLCGEEELGSTRFGGGCNFSNLFSWMSAQHGKHLQVGSAEMMPIVSVVRALLLMWLLPAV